MKAPDRIFLQNPELGDGATWCDDRIAPSDVEYVRADLLKALSRQSSPEKSPEDSPEE